MCDEIFASQPVDHELFALSSPVQISDVIWQSQLVWGFSAKEGGGHTCRGFEMARGVVALGDVYSVVSATLKGLVDGDGWSCESFFYSAQSLVAGLELEVVIAGAFCDGGDDGDPVAAGTDVVCGRYDGDVYICTP